MIIQGGMIWISCALALTFSVYAAIKKKGGFDALRGMTLESLITGVLGMAFFALTSAFPVIWSATPPSYDALAVDSGALTCALLVVAGALTVAPLLLYSAAANNVPFVILGFMQYLSPTISMLVAVFPVRRGVHPRPRRLLRPGVGRPHLRRRRERPQPQARREKDERVRLGPTFDVLIRLQLRPAPRPGFSRCDIQRPDSTHIV